MALPMVLGRVAWVFAEDNFDVDQIVGVKNIKLTDVAQLAAIAMKSYDPEFASAIRKGDIIVGGRNFGYGHPHYPPMRALVHLGIGGVIAESFSPGFWRGEISTGLPMIACTGIVAAVQRWDEVEVNWDRAQVIVSRTGKTLPFDPLSQGDRMMMEEGGLIPYLKRAVEADRRRANDKA